MKPNRIAKLVLSVIPFMSLFLAASPALAGLPPPMGNIPEPGILSLVGLGGVVLAAVAIRNRRNKK